MLSLLLALTPYEAPPHISITAPGPICHSRNPRTVGNFRSASIGWVPTLYLGKPSKGFYRAICAIGFAATPSSPVVVKIARDEMVEITSVSSETWNYKKLDGSGVTGLVNPTCLVKVELDTEPPAYPPPPGPERLELERDAVEAKAKVGKGERFWSLPLGTRMRWSNFRPMRRGRPSPTVEAKARTLLETEGKGHDASGRLGEAQRLYFDTEAVQDWSTQVEGDGHTLGGETAIEGGEATEGNEPAVQPAGVRHKDGPLWLGSV